MKKEYTELLARAEAELSLNRKMLKNIKKKQSDPLFQKHHDDVFEGIDCLACANCCITTGPLVLERDIDRISKHLKLKPVDFINRYLRRDEDNDWVFKSMPCPFLDTEYYCQIYAVRPKACREYPHTDRKNIHQLFGKTLVNSTICPAVVMIFDRIKKDL
ncbi:MAG: YkgJ family cysteine cluster protein [Spirochaetales bacterium]|nr:YkgJ family cysteine cluster protein [Spirochaetales bacterium]